MVNRILIVPQTRHVTERVTEHVHEHRAPTDESVRLLADMEAKVREKIVEAVRVGDTTFECVIHVERRLADDSIRLLAIFSVNGKKMQAECVWPIKSGRPKQALIALRDAVALKIATEALIPALQSLELRSWEG